MSLFPLVFLSVVACARPAPFCFAARLVVANTISVYREWGARAVVVGEDCSDIVVYVVDHADADADAEVRLLLWYLVWRLSCQRKTEGVGFVADADDFDDIDNDHDASHDFDVGDVVMVVVGNVVVAGGVGGGGDIGNGIVRF